VHRPQLTEDEWLALGAVAGGLISAFGLYLFATNRPKDAAAIGIATAITGAFIAGAKFVGSGGEAGDVIIDIME
jgi:hypothetical protein